MSYLRGVKQRKSDVLAAMEGIVPTRLLFGARSAPPGGVAVFDWSRAEACAIASSAYRGSST